MNRTKILKTGVGIFKKSYTPMIYLYQLTKYNVERCRGVLQSSVFMSSGELRSIFK